MDNGGPMKIYILIICDSLGDGCYKLLVILIGPGIVDGEVVFLIRRKLVRKGPLDLIVIKDLHIGKATMLLRFTLWDILFHSLLAASLTTGTSPS